MKKEWQNTQMASENSLHPFILFIQENGRLILITLTLLTALILLAYRLTSSHSSQAEADYATGAREFLLFQSNYMTDREAAANALSNLNGIMDQHPELHAKYDGLIAQILLYQSNITEAQPYIDRIKQRIKNDHLPLYARYSNTTLTIDSEDYKQALIETSVLKQMLVDNQQNEIAKDSFGETLLSFTLLRLASLQQKLGSPSEAAAAWREWRTSVDKMHPSIFQTMHEIKIGNFSLLNYAEEQSKK